MGQIWSRAARDGALLPAPVYITVDGQPEKTLALTHIDAGRSSLSQLRLQVLSQLSLPPTTAVRVFDPANGDELCSETVSLSGRFYIVTVDGSELGEHPKSVFRRTVPLTAGPPTLPLLGNTLQLVSLARQGLNFTYIFDRILREYSAAGLNAIRFTMPSFGSLVITGDAALARAVTSDESVWDKTLPKEGALAAVRENLTPTGLFTNGSEMETWSVAHRILLPSFSVKNLRQYFPTLLRQMGRLIRRLEGMAAAGTNVDVPDLMTRITLDSIGICGFDFDFMMIENDSVHPFVGAMSRGLGLTQAYTNSPPWTRWKQGRGMIAEMGKQRAIMAKVVRDVLDKRQENKERKSDILDMMLHATDPVTGTALSTANIIDQLITFLIAGHETTSGLLSFVWYLLSVHPEVEAKVIAEVDAVLGRDPSVPMDWKQISQLRYLDMVMKETLRLYSTAPAINKVALRDTRFDQYYLPKGIKVVLNLYSLHRDPAVWTEPEKFLPERFLTDPAPGSYFPFGSGQRACIGMAFALMEAKMVIALTLQRFRLRVVPGYKFDIVSVLTIKPKNLYMNVVARDPNENLAANAPVFSSQATEADTPPHASVPTPVKVAATATPDSLLPLSIYFGSNMGACQEMAQRLAETALHYGMRVSVSDLDSLAVELDAGASGAVRNVLVVTSTYNGKPPDNARKFAQRLAAGGSQSCAGLRYAVFGCGNSQWTSTFQKFPLEVDECLSRMGGDRVHARGLADANTDWDEAIENWERTIWQAFFPTSKLGATRTAPSASFQVDVVDEPAVDVDFSAGMNVVDVEVVESRELLNQDGPRSVRHLELRLGGEKGAYRAGDHLGVLPRNNEAVVDAFAARLGFNLDRSVRIRALNEVKSDLGLPLDRPISLRQLLRDYLDLQAPLNRKAVAKLAALTDCTPEKAELEAAVADFKASAIGVNRDPLPAVLDRYRSLQPSLTDIVDLLPLLRPRYYSISSSPLLDGDGTVSLTVARLLWTDGRGQQRDGLCSRYLVELGPGDRIKAWVRPAPAPFHLPTDVKRPLLMIGPGTGIAPMRSFIRERVAEARAGADIGPMVLVFGCRHQAKDFLYGDELGAYAADLGDKFTLLTAFSRDGKRKVYVQDVIRDEKARIGALVKAGAKIFVSGDAKSMAPAVRQAIADVIGPGQPNLVKDLLASNDYVEDVWANSF